MPEENTARAFSETPDFKSKCEIVGIPPSKRQAAKFLAGKGKVYKEWKSKSANVTADLKNQAEG